MNIIDAKTRFRSGIEFNSCEYTLDENGRFGVRLLNHDIEIYQKNIGFSIKLKNRRISREKLAEFLWVAATLLDSEERYKPDTDLIGINYE